MAYENIGKGKNELSLSLKNNKWLQIKPELLMQALPHVAMFMKHGLCNLKEIVAVLWNF
ncbi:MULTISPECIES: hypothetical protein [unclassified Bartonella]|uniref:hypothetical protein n=1 Tax=unclassified Bartonella TaxID=2645622 RepID=UPI0035CFDBBD